MAVGAGRQKAAEKIRLSFPRRMGDHLEKSTLGAKKFHVQVLVAHEDHRE